MNRPFTPLGILGAMPEEIEQLLQALADGRVENRAGVEIHSGTLAGIPVLIAQSGVGKVNAAAAAQTLLLQGVRGLLFTGVAGTVAPELNVGDLVVCEDAVQHDVDVTALGYRPGEVPGQPLAWRADPELVQLAEDAARTALGGVTVKRGRVASGDQFVASEEHTGRIAREFSALCVEMEGAAVAQVCARAGIPFAIIRSISDSADSDARLSFREFTDLAAGQAKRVVLALCGRLAGGGAGSPA